MARHTFLRSSLPGLIVMRATLLLPVVAVALAACGDLSQEDLVFRAAVPPKDAVALVVPGVGDAGDGGSALSAHEQGLGACADGDLRCDATTLARGFNCLTFTLLDTVDAVTALPPSQRARGHRVWGPHFDFGKNRTFRFEMNREDDGVTYSFCLHVADGRVTDNDVGDIDCTSADDVMANVFSGAFQPSSVAGDGARQGAGTMRFEAEKVRRFDGGDRFADVLNFAFDNADDEVHIDIAADGVPTDDDDDAGTAAGYSFDRDARGAGELSFEFFANLVSEGLIPQRRLEHVNLRAQWAADQSGRAIAVVDGGDLDPGQEVTVDQCWDASLTTTRFQGVDGEVSVGPDDDDICAFSVDDVRG